MKNGTKRVLDDLHTLVRELEASFKDSPAAEGIGEAGERMQEGLARARSRIEELEGRLRSGMRRSMKATDRYVRTNPWRSMGIVAAVAFIVGALVSRRD